MIAAFIGFNGCDKNEVKPNTVTTSSPTAPTPQAIPPRFPCPHYHGQLAGWPTPNPNNLVYCTNCYCVFSASTTYDGKTVYLSLPSGASIEYLDEDYNVIDSYTTNDRGEWNGGNVPAGTYTLRVTCTGYQTTTTEVTVSYDDEGYSEHSIFVYVPKN